MQKSNHSEHYGAPATPNGVGMRSPKARTLIGFSAVIMLLFCGYVAYQASKAYSQAVEDGKTNAARLTKILADEVELTFLTVDLTLRRAVERQYFNTMFGGNLPHDIENNFRLWVEETPQIVALMLVDEKGIIDVAANKRGYDQWYSYTDSVDNDPAFQAMRDDPERNYYIGEQRTRSITHPQLIVMSRRITKMDGSFGGVMMAALDPKFFKDFFMSVDTGSHRFMTLMLDDGTVLYTGAEDDPARDMANDYIAAKVAAHPGAKEVVTGTQNMDGSLKIFAYANLRNMPITSAIVVDENDFLAQWREARLRDLRFLIIFTLFGSVLSYFSLNMAKQIKRVEESESAAILASQAKSEFLANMSHELRTPLNAVIGFSEMLGAGYFGPMNDKQKERVQDINLCGTHLLQLISDILEFSKGEAGKLELHEEEMDMKRAVEEAARIVGERAKAKQITVLTEVEDRLPTLVADKRKVRQILLNLLSNAIKFTPSQGRITIGLRMEPHGQMQLVVSDTGIGIPEDDIPKALAVFGQVHRNQSHEGTGLGLPLCKMFAELHGGKLQLTSVVGEGTTVRISFPAERVCRPSDIGNEHPVG